MEPLPFLDLVDPRRSRSSRRRTCRWKGSGRRTGPGLVRPTSSMIASRSSCFASAWPISLISASSAARACVSPRSRFVSSTSRAFSTATPTPAARVATSCWSASLKASGRRLPRATAPMTRRPARIGTRRIDSVMLASAGRMAPSAFWSARWPRRSTRPVRMTIDVSPWPIAIGSVWMRRPPSNS